MRTRTLFSLLALSVLPTGCVDEAATEKPAEAEKENVQRGPGGLKMTQEVGEFDPAANKEVANSDVKISNPITGALDAYQPLKEQVAGMGIGYAVRQFHALEGRYPKDHDEFMEKIIKANNIRLPTLGKGKSYEYDVENHKLVIVIDQPAGQ